MKNKILILLIAAGFSTLLYSCCCGDRTPEPPKKIEVTGSAEMEIVPNEIYMTFSLREYLDAAKKKVTIETIKTEFLALCKSAGVADSCISISGYSGNERWDYSWYRRRKSEPDFMSAVSYTVKAPSSEKLDKIVEGLNETATENFYLSKTSHSDIEKLRKEVKTRALVASKNKAEYLAKSIGEDLGEALLIQEVENSYTPYYANELLSNSNVSQEALYMDGDESASAPDFQKMKLRYEMRVEFRLK